jgi:hypothetical protein
MIILSLYLYISLFQFISLFYSQFPRYKFRRKKVMNFYAVLQKISREETEREGMEGMEGLRGGATPQLGCNDRMKIL